MLSGVVFRRGMNRDLVLSSDGFEEELRKDLSQEPKSLSSKHARREKIFFLPILGSGMDREKETVCETAPSSAEKLFGLERPLHEHSSTGILC